jgi:surfactin synthase thioesterase subunit
MGQEYDSNLGALGRWLSIRRRVPKPFLRLICFHFAGGGASAFSSWHSALPADVEVCAVQLPGREDRLQEARFSELEPLIAATLSGIGPALDGSCPYALFGHSMGALVAFELARELRRRRQVGPRLLIASGASAPQVRSMTTNHDKPRAELVQFLRSLGGTPEALLQDEELLDVFLPIFRADLAVCETYRYYEEPRLTCPIVALGGEDDQHCPAEEVKAWREQTEGRFRSHFFPGGHHFIRHSAPAVLMTVCASIDSCAPGYAPALHGRALTY